ncbi:unnamed protein product [Penicillium camemberti]|uniref:Str. FM013 n=1 Tax=Penicillium camemberti (strain FM 013) TaxID=1429867 RepID=A0A0G4P0B2_PENC3|nr:unnamed protein product [Penicillium camemberti]
MQSILDICASAVSPSCTPPCETPMMNTLAGLPVELLLSITDFLPPTEKKKLPVLRRLERDLPKYFVCYVCHILHKYHGPEFFGLYDGGYDQENCPLRCLPKWKKGELSLRLRDQDPLWFHAYRRFFFIHLQLAMRRFYYGENFGISTEALSYTQVCTYPGPPSCPEITSLFSTDAQICPKTPGLCLRIQQMMFVHSRAPTLLLSRRDAGWMGAPPEIMFICIHISHKRHARLLDNVVKAYLNGMNALSSTYTCKICTAECRIEVCEYGSDLALVLTTWINLGAGLTPDDPQWIVHSCDWVYNRVTLDPNHRKDSSRLCFENVSPRSLEALRSCNLSYLKDQRFKQVMYEIYGDTRVWYLPPKGSWGNYLFMS